MTLLSTISNDSVNDNLRKRFENAEIYVCIVAFTTPFSGC
jgi:myosin-1